MRCNRAASLPASAQKTTCRQPVSESTGRSRFVYDLLNQHTQLAKQGPTRYVTAMALSDAERQARFRERRAERMSELQSENERLRQEVERLKRQLTRQAERSRT
jgi:hypothetical protein